MALVPTKIFSSAHSLSHVSCGLKDSVLCLSSRGELNLMSSASRQVKSTWRVGGGTDPPIYALLSPDGTAIATVTAGGKYNVFSSSASEISSAPSPSSGNLSLPTGARVTRVLHHEASSVVGFVCGSSVQFLLFDPKALRLKPSQLPAISLPLASCDCVFAFHPQHSLLLWCIGTAALAGHVACVRCSDGRVMSKSHPPCPALADTHTTLSCAALDDLACVVVACSNGALVTAALSEAPGASSHSIDVAVLLPPAAAASSADVESQASGKKRTKQQQQQQQDGHVCIAAIHPCNVAVAWGARASRPPFAAVYDCAFGSCRATISLDSLDASERLVMHHAASLLLIADASSVFTCDVRAHAQHVSLADAAAADVGLAASKGMPREAVFTQTLEKLQEICVSSATSSLTPATHAQDLSSGAVNAIDSDLVMKVWQQQQQQNEASAVTCAMVVKRIVAPSTAAAFVNAAAVTGNWSDVMTCVRGGGVALSHCPNLVADAAAAGQTPVMLECLLRCVDVLEADVVCVLTYALHTGTPAAFQSLAAYIASAPAASASSSSAPATTAATQSKKGKKASEKTSGSIQPVASGSSDAARRALLHAALRARVSEVSILPLLRQMPQRAIVRLLRYLRSLMLNDSAADITVTGGSKDCNTVPSLQRVVEWCSICMDAFGLQLAATQEGREICAGLKRAAQVQQQAAVAMGGLHGIVQQLMERAKMPAQGRPARSIDLVHL